MFGRDMIELPTSRFSICVGWVDDKTLLVDVRVEDMCLKVGSAIWQALSWTDTCGSSFDPEKSGYLIFSPTRNPTSLGDI